MDIVLSFYWRKIATHLAPTVLAISGIEAVKKGKKKKNRCGAQGIYIVVDSGLAKKKKKPQKMLRPNLTILFGTFYYKLFSVLSKDGVLFSI